MKADVANNPERHGITSDRVRHVAGKGLHEPSSLTASELRELCGSVLAHIARHENGEVRERRPIKISDVFGLLKEDDGPHLTIEEMGEIAAQGWAGKR